MCLMTCALRCAYFTSSFATIRFGWRISLVPERVVPNTECPCASTSCASTLPNPREMPLMNQLLIPLLLWDSFDAVATGFQTGAQRLPITSALRRGLAGHSVIRDGGIEAQFLDGGSLAVSLVAHLLIVGLPVFWIDEQIANGGSQLGFRL